MMIKKPIPPYAMKAVIEILEPHAPGLIPLLKGYNKSMTMEEAITILRRNSDEWNCRDCRSLKSAFPEGSYTIVSMAIDAVLDHLGETKPIADCRNCANYIDDALLDQDDRCRKRQLGECKAFKKKRWFMP